MIILLTEALLFRTRLHNRYSRLASAGPVYNYVANSWLRAKPFPKDLGALHYLRGSSLWQILDCANVGAGLALPGSFSF